MTPLIREEPVMPPEGDHLGVADRDAGNVLNDHGLLVVGQQVGRGTIEAAQGASMQAARVPAVRSQVGITTRNLDQASQAQNRQVLPPSMRGPSPQSNWHHMPGSGTQGR
jgi:hypothetical protein